MDNCIVCNKLVKSPKVDVDIAKNYKSHIDCFFEGASIPSVTEVSLDVRKSLIQERIDFLVSEHEKKSEISQ